MKTRTLRRLTTALTLALAMTPLFNLTYAADNTSLTTQRDAALNAMHQDLAAQQFQYVMDWPALAIYAAGDSVTAPRWTTASGQNGVTWKAQQVQNQTSLTDTTTDFESGLLALLAAGQNPRNFVRKDYLEAVTDSQLPDGKFADSITGTGEDLLNAHIYGILSLYAADVPIPNHDLAQKYLFDHQHTDGGFDWSNDSTTSSPDVTAEALVAMKALGLDSTDTHVQAALNYLKTSQNTNGGFSNEGTENPDSDAAVIEALLAYGIDPNTFANNGHSVVSDLLSFQLADGSFAYTKGGTANPMSTQNGALALAELVDGENVYQKLHDQYAGKSSTWTSAFSDLPVTSSEYAANMHLINEGIMAGNPDFTYQPDASLTREQFAKIIVYAITGRDQVGPKITRFKDLPTTQWSNPFVQVAYTNKLMVGTTDTTFDPSGTVTGAQVMAILVRGLDKEQQAQAVPNQKNWYDGYVQVAQQLGLEYPNFSATAPATRTQMAEAFNQFYVVGAKLFS